MIKEFTPRKNIASALAAEAGYGGRYAEEILALAGVDKSKKVRDLSAEEIERIVVAAEKLQDLIRKGPPVVAYSPKGEIQPLPYPMKSLESKGWRYRKTESINEAFRVAYEEELARGIEAEKRKVVEEKIRDLERKAREKRFSAEKLLSSSSKIRQVAEKLFQHSSLLNALADKPGDHEVSGLEIRVDRDLKKMHVKIGEESIDLDLKESLMKQISSLFDKAKKSEQAARRLISEAEELEREAEKLRKSSGKELEKILLKVSARVKRGEGKWYERYRWFTTSEGYLAVAGKDASSNIALLRKHLENKDLVFHAEVRGAAAVILKNGQEAGGISKREAAQFAAVYSRAWRERMSSMTVYYVNPDQISFTPPPGHYLPKGGFIVKGERTYLTVKLELAIGLTDDLKLIYGPPSAVAGKTKTYVKIVPGNEKADALASEILQTLLKNVELESRKLRDLKIEISELIPYGRGEITR